MCTYWQMDGESDKVQQLYMYVLKQVEASFNHLIA